MCNFRCECGNGCGCGCSCSDTPCYTNDERTTTRAFSTRAKVTLQVFVSLFWTFCFDWTLQIFIIIENQFIYKQHKIARAQYVNIFSSKKVTVLPSWRQSILLPPTCNMLVSWVELSTLRILRNLHLFHVVFVTCPSFFLLFPRFLFFLSLLFLCELACAVVSAVAISAVPSAGDSMASALTTLRQVGTLMPIRPLVFYTFISLPMLPKKIISMNTTKISAC